MKFVSIALLAALAGVAVAAPAGEEHTSSATPSATTTPVSTSASTSATSVATSASTSSAGDAGPIATPAPVAPEKLNAVPRAQLEEYCAKAPAASAPCGLMEMCQKAGDRAPAWICGTTALAKAVCTIDRVSAKPLCDTYAATCSNAADCEGLGWPAWMSSGEFQGRCWKMCDFHASRNETMAGCERAPKPAGGVPQDLNQTDFDKLGAFSGLDVFRVICNDMPKMGGCRAWREQCAAVPDVQTIFSDYCGAEAMAAAKVSYTGLPKPATATASTTAASASPTQKAKESESKKNSALASVNAVSYLGSAVIGVVAVLAL